MAFFNELKKTLNSLPVVGTIMRELMPKARYKVAAYYYPWYFKKNWENVYHHYNPSLGLYDTSEPDVAEKHITWASQYGIDIFINSWWGSGSVSDWHIKKGMLSASNISKIKFAILYETLGESRLGKPPLDFYNPALVERIILEFRYLKENYFDHPDYWRIKNRPVVVLHNSRFFRNFKEEYVEEIKKAVGRNVYLISDEVYFENQASPKTARNQYSGFDAFTSFSMYEKKMAEKLEFQSPFQFYKNYSHSIYENWAEETTFMPCLSPDFKEFNQGPSRSDNFEEFKKMIQMAKNLPYKHAVSKSIDQVFFINSFNQWFDWSIVEPSEEFGRDYLEVIRECFKK